jgi:hypothetical protein
LLKKTLFTFPLWSWFVLFQSFLEKPVYLYDFSSYLTLSYALHLLAGSVDFLDFQRHSWTDMCFSEPEPRVLASPHPPRLNILSFQSLLPGTQLESLSISWRLFFHVMSYQRSEPESLQTFWVSELNKFAYMIRCQFCCHHIAQSLQVWLLFSKWTPQMWTLGRFN